MTDDHSYHNAKADRLGKKTDGQAFDHELESSREWEQTLDVLHHLFLQTWYYIAIAANTNGGMFTPILKNSINLKRTKQEIPTELQTVLKMRISTFGDLDKQIERKALTSGNKDIWHFRTKWKEFPEGTSIIAIQQRPLWNLLSSTPTFRKAFIIIDGQAEVQNQNQAMFLISKVLHNQEFAEKSFKSIGKKAAPPEAKPRPRTKTIYTGRPTGELVLLLKEAFGIHVRTLSVEEKVALGYYFERLKRTGEQDESHVEIWDKLKKHFKTEDLKKGEH
ncbi:MAG: hypothetical protein A2600_09450 [Candidatus Lambdaproteobacteria bacterium RIFOXYD1_FULL_56_27]|uniref:Uncharacterized protein n=1 Tax=Candidatus Lambdaproteobacteria bacterium RIFOXYD2_FULL_56_26 TaxID=1817773 RepID=A0A1F6GUP4_9PROT|nr:MAG: hypothetical protein A2557_04720 [Candidatus Lambdaproteobacteria bacterium RIFOXYD2_FULL_56_26]OGH02276.1 MAG: hypothetical protein A2426_03200 [Candidatus Lambdaproteobacteria bacterium RIFOXYC1_FULL_56_13]OGH10045.1 MAG: hypothetical protein A2600_09450 [Candidatus Lambdaproteobacteria bacterium RIFOXYD1_FULL_56_27]